MHENGLGPWSLPMQSENPTIHLHGSIAHHSLPNELFDNIPHIENIGHGSTLILDAYLRSGPGRGSTARGFVMLLSELLSHISPEIKVASFDRLSAVQLPPTT